MHLVDYVVTQGSREAGLGRARSTNHHALRGERSRVDLARPLTRAVDATVSVARMVRVVARLEGVRIDEQLVGVHAVAGVVDVRQEPRAGARCEGRIVRPVRPVRTKAVKNSPCDALLGELARLHDEREHPRGVTRHGQTQTLRLSEALSKEAQLDTCRARRTRANLEVSAREHTRAEARTERPRIDGAFGANVGSWQLRWHEGVRRGRASFGRSLVRRGAARDERRRESDQNRRANGSDACFHETPWRERDVRRPRSARSRSDAPQRTTPRHPRLSSGHRRLPSRRHPSTTSAGRCT